MLGFHSRALGRGGLHVERLASVLGRRLRILPDLDRCGLGPSRLRNDILERALNECGGGVCDSGLDALLDEIVHEGLEDLVESAAGGKEERQEELWRREIFRRPPTLSGCRGSYSRGRRCPLPSSEP